MKICIIGYGKMGKMVEKNGSRGREKEEERGGWESVGVKCFRVKMKAMQQRSNYKPGA